jgi:hypothetical protein
MPWIAGAIPATSSVLICITAPTFQVLEELISLFLGSASQDHYAIGAQGQRLAVAEHQRYTIRDSIRPVANIKGLFAFVANHNVPSFLYCSKVISKAFAIGQSLQ